MNTKFSFYSNMSKRQQSYLFLMYNLSQSSSVSIHNLSNIKSLPESVKILLFLGLKFSLNQKPNYKNIFR